MKLFFKQRFFSWLDRYDIYYEDGSVAYTVQGKIAWGHKLVIFDAFGNEVGVVRERVFVWLPQFELYEGGVYRGRIRKKFRFFSNDYAIECNGWQVDGDPLGWDYTIFDAAGSTVAAVSKELWNFTDTYVMDVVRPEDALLVLMFTLAIDAEKCSNQ